MSKVMAVLGAAGFLAVLATPALAAEPTTARDIQAAVDSYVSSAQGDASLVGGPGSAGYDAGFWIRGGDFSLRINATLQARWEAINWDSPEPSANNLDGFGQGGGDKSGFSLPRAMLKFSGTAPCNTRYYVELDFGHIGFLPTNWANAPAALGAQPNLQSGNFANTREAWIEWGCSPCLNFRMGQIKLATTRQLMTPPELQQFVDISLASTAVGQTLPGYTDRNRDHGLMLHGAFGCNNEFSYILQVTNGDSGDSIRNIHDGRTEDGVAVGGRLNWAFLGATGYEEGALRQNTCTWYGELGAWGYYNGDRTDYPHTNFGDNLRVGGDLQLGYGGLSFTAAYNYVSTKNSVALAVGNYTANAILVQAGYLFPDTAWEIAGRWSMFSVTPTGGAKSTLSEFGGAINYYLNGHGNKLTLDVSFVGAGSAVNAALSNWGDVYAGYAGLFRTAGGVDNDVIMIRFQWQLAL